MLPWPCDYGHPRVQVISYVFFFLFSLLLFWECVLIFSSWDPTESTVFCSCSQTSVSKQYLSLGMAPQSSTLAWKIPWTEEPGRLQSMGLLGVRHDWATSLSLFSFMHWRRKRQPAPVFLRGESQEQGSLVGCHLWGRTESDTTEVT